MMTNKEKFGKCIEFLLCFAYVVGVIGGVGYAIYCKEYVIAVCLLLTGGMALPVVTKMFNHLKS